MVDQRKQRPQWLDLPTDLWELIAQRSRDTVTGVTVFRSVCRTWRAAVRQVPRLRPLPVAHHRRGGGSEYTLEFPVSGGWLIIVDVRDASCRLRHPAAGVTAALPRITALRDGATSEATDVLYKHYADDGKSRFPDFDPCLKIYTKCGTHKRYMRSYMEFSQWFRFFVVVSPCAPAGSTKGMSIMMYQFLERGMDIVQCCPGDVAWTKITKLAMMIWPVESFAYFDHKIFANSGHRVMKVFDTTRFELLNKGVDLPHRTNNLDPENDEYFNFVALPSKLLLFRASMRSFEPTDFAVFELVVSGSRDDAFSWRKMTGDIHDDNGGSYDLYVDNHHATFCSNNTGIGSRIYYLFGMCYNLRADTWNPKVAAYCYNMKDSKIRCLYRKILHDDPDYCCDDYSTTTPGWFFP